MVVRWWELVILDCAPTQKEKKSAGIMLRYRIMMPMMQFFGLRRKIAPQKTPMPNF